MSRERFEPATESKEKSQASEIFALYQARLRAEEIDFAAREQYQEDRKKLVDSSIAKVNNDFKIQSRDIDRNAKIQFSVTKNEQRIKVLMCQQDIVSKAMDGTRTRLATLRNSAEYANIVVKLIKQGLEVLNEEEAVVLCMAKDFDLVEKCLRTALQGRHGTASVNREFPLEESVIGGVIVANANGTIRCDNTFEGRLQLATEGSLPQIGKVLKA